MYIYATLPKGFINTVLRQLAHKEDTTNSSFDDSDCVGSRTPWLEVWESFLCLNNLVFFSNLEPPSNPRDPKES